MENKEELKKLVETVKNNSKLSGRKIKNEDIAKRMGITRTYLSDLLGMPGKDVTEKHVEDFKAHYREELLGEVKKPSTPQKKVNMQYAMLKTLYQRMAKSEAARLGLPLEQVLKDMDDETMLNWHDLENDD